MPTRRVHLDGADPRQRLGEEAHAGVRSQRRQGQSAQSPGGTEGKGLDQVLAQDDGGAGAKGEAHGGLVTTADDADQEQSGEVGAGDEEDDDDGKKEGTQQRPGSGFGCIGERLDQRANAGRAHGRGEVALNLAVRGLHILQSLGEGHAGSEARQHPVIPASSAVDEIAFGKTDGNPQFAAVELAWDEGKLEGARHHADDFVGCAVEEDLRSGDVRIVVEAAVPHRIADDGDGLVLFVLTLRKGTPQ